MQCDPLGQDSLSAPTASSDSPLTPSLPLEGQAENAEPHTRADRALLPPDPLVLPSSEALVVAEFTGSLRLDAWLVPPHTQSRRTHGRGRGQKGHAMTQPLVELVEQFCLYQLKQRGRTKGGVEAARWVLF